MQTYIVKQQSCVEVHNSASELTYLQSFSLTERPWRDSGEVYALCGSMQYIKIIQQIARGA